MIKASINGFGRVGRLALRVWLQRQDIQKELNIIAINTSGSMPIAGWAHLLKYDTAYGTLQNKISIKEVKQPEEVTDTDSLIGHLNIDSHQIAVLAQRDPLKLPWNKHQIDLVIEATGKFRKEKDAALHLKAGAKKVLLSAPAKEGNIGSYVIGVNKYTGKHQIADNASCTTNCTAPIIGILHAKFGIKKAALTTIHAYTDGQRLQDNSHKDLRRARAAALNMVPTTTGAAKSTTGVIPDLKDKFDGFAIRVPVITGSISDITALINKKTTIEEVNQTFKDAEKNPLWKGIVATTSEPLVSSDIIGRNESAIVDLEMTRVIDGDLVKIVAWYDNEWGYAARLMEQAVNVGK